MTRCVLPPDASPSPEQAVPAGAATRMAVGGTNTQHYIENPELKVYVEDAIRLVLAARPERPLDLIDSYLQSVLGQDNVVGREYAYVNATMRNRRAFVRAVHEVFVGGGVGGSDSCPAVGDDGASRSEGVGVEPGGGFAQKDVVHLLGLVCPDFPEELVAQEFFEDARALFGSSAFGVQVDTGRGVIEGGDAQTRDRDISVSVLLDQLQAMKAEPRNQLRYMDVRFTRAAVRRGGLGERATLPALFACLLLHSHEAALSLLESPPADGYSERMEACPALWSDGRTTPQSSSGDGGDAGAESQGRKKKGARKAISNGRSVP
eukprot:jgi/Undpi1/13086/HiC_scaffold_8.g02748.m1